jgi:hypothetical protein
MKKSKMGVLSVALPLGLGLSLALSACGGSDSDGNGNAGGTAGAGGTKATSGGSGSSAAGMSSKAGSSGSGTGTNGGTGNNPGNGGDVPGDTPLSDLTDDQVDQLCEDFGERFSGAEFDDTACRMTSVFSAILAQSDEQAQQLCKMAYDECKASPPDTTESCEKPGAECTATVDELNACLDDINETFGSLGDAIPSCDTLKLTDVAGLFAQFGSFMNPESCATYEEKCPDGPQVPTAGAMP